LAKIKNTPFRKGAAKPGDVIPPKGDFPPCVAASLSRPRGQKKKGAMLFGTPLFGQNLV